MTQEPTVVYVAPTPTETKEQYMKRILAAVTLAIAAASPNVHAQTAQDDSNAIKLVCLNQANHIEQMAALNHKSVKQQQELASAFFDKCWIESYNQKLCMRGS